MFLQVRDAIRGRHVDAETPLRARGSSSHHVPVEDGAAGHVRAGIVTTGISRRSTSSDSSTTIRRVGGDGGRCGTWTGCEYLEGEDRLPACPEGAVFLHEHTDRRPTLPGAAPAAPRPARTPADRRHAAAVEQMAAELAQAYPDPVDLFEDDLARKLGLAALGDSQTVRFAARPRADLFRQLSVPESRDTTSIPATRRLEPAKKFRVPPGGGRPTDPEWTERRLIPLSRGTLKRLEELASRLQVAPLQMAALLLEKTVDSIRDEELQRLSQAAPGPK